MNAALSLTNRVTTSWVFITFDTTLKITRSGWHGNLLSKNLLCFWFTVGGSYIVRGTTTESIVFVVTAIGTLITSKIAVALLAANFLPSLESRGYLATMKVLAALLAIFGLLSLSTAYHLVAANAQDF